MRSSLFARAIAVVGVVGVLTGSAVGTAQALSVNSASGVFYANPYNYLNYANIDNTAKVARAYIRRDPSASIPANRVGVQARLYRSDNNNLCTSSSYTINASVTTLYGQSTNSSYCGPISHYSRGLTKANAGGSTWIQYPTYDVSLTF